MPKVDKDGLGIKGDYMITSVGFGSAPSMSQDLTKICHPYVTTIIHAVSARTYML